MGPTLPRVFWSILFVIVVHQAISAVGAFLGPLTPRPRNKALQLMRPPVGASRQPSMPLLRAGVFDTQNIITIPECEAGTAAG